MPSRHAQTWTDARAERTNGNALSSQEGRVGSCTHSRRERAGDGLRELGTVMLAELEVPLLSVGLLLASGLVDLRGVERLLACPEGPAPP